MSLKPHISAALKRIQPSATLAMTARVAALKAGVLRYYRIVGVKTS